MSTSRSIRSSALTLHSAIKSSESKGCKCGKNAFQAGTAGSKQINNEYRRKSGEWFQPWGCHLFVPIRVVLVYRLLVLTDVLTKRVVDIFRVMRLASLGVT